MNLLEQVRRCRELENYYDQTQFHDAIRALDLAALEAALEDGQEDKNRLRHLGDEPFCDDYGGVDLHEYASIYASAFGRDEPNSNDYLAAVRKAIDKARAK